MKTSLNLKKTTLKTTLKIAPIGAAIVAAAFAARSCAAQGGLQGRVTLDGVPNGANLNVVVRDMNKARGTTGANTKQAFTLRPGQPSAWFALDEPGPGRYFQVVVEAPGVQSMNVTLETQGAGRPQTAREEVQGDKATFFKRASERGGIEVIAAAQVYREGLERAKAVAVPENMRPRRFLISDYLVGADENLQSLRDGLQTIALLGSNTANVHFFDGLSSQVVPIAQQFGITRFRRAVYKTPSYFAWDAGAQDPALVQAWAQKQAQASIDAGLPPKQVGLFHMSDEPGWYYPAVTEEIAATPRGLEMFRAYLRKNGMQPGDLGAASWAQVRPQGASRARDLPSRRLFYWTVRFVTESASDAFRTYGDALRRQFGPDTMITTNWNNWISNFYTASPDKAIGHNTVVSADSALGRMDWMDFARKKANPTLWSEDWFKDQDAQNWDFYADALRSAAREGDLNFGGHIIGRMLGDHPAGARYKAMSLIGHGGKAIMWYAYGPEPLFAGNTYSDKPESFGAVASANRLIGRAEDLLYPGKPTPARVAIFLPSSAQMWDEARTSLYQREMMGLHYSLMHAHYPVEFIDETGIAAGQLAQRGFNVLYVTAPNMTAAAQNALRGWINNGGTAVFSPGAAAADEYNTPTNILDATLGVRSDVIPRLGIKDSAKVRTKLSFREPSFGSNMAMLGPTTPLRVAGGDVLAEFDNGGPALVANRAGKGLALSYGFWPGAAYYLFVNRADANRLPQNWNADLRRIATAAPRVTGVPKPVDLSEEVVEAARLDSPAGIAVTLLNWTDEPINQLEVTVHNAGQVASVGTAEGGTLPFTRQGDDIRIRLPLRDVDVLMLRR